MQVRFPNSVAALTIFRLAADVNEPSYYGLVSNVVGRTPDLVVIPLPGVVFASPGKKLSEHGGLMQPDVNVALMVYAPGLATAGTTQNATVCLHHVHMSARVRCSPEGVCSHARHFGSSCICWLAVAIK